MFDVLAAQLARGTPRTLENYEPPKKVRNPRQNNRNVAVKLRDTATGEILTFASLSKIREYFCICDVRPVLGLLDNPTLTWRGHQAKLYEDDSEWARPAPRHETVWRQSGKRVQILLVTRVSDGTETLCVGYQEASELTGKNQSWLAKLVCYHHTPKGAAFTVRVACRSDFERFPLFELDEERMFFHP